MKKTVSDQELEVIIKNLQLHGQEEIFTNMRSKALFVMDQVDDMDEVFLDMSDDVLKKARKEEDEHRKKDLYVISFLLRRVAHQVYRKYIKGGKQRLSERFLRSV